MNSANTWVALATSVVVLVNADTAFAQDDTRQWTVEEITVTGSRIRRTTDFDTPNPTTVVNSDFLKNLGIVNIGEAVKQLPANLSNNSPTTTGNANFFAGSTIANLRGLNPFFGSRTLNLVNNRRFVPTNQGDGVDLNFIPQILIERLDVVTGGASAAYGSGAISGVNNVFLNRTLQGGKVEVDYSQTEEGDGDDMHAAFAYGDSVFDGRGHFVVGYEHQDSEAVGCIRVRGWCAEGIGFYQNPAAPPGFILGRNIRENQISTTGVWLNGAPGATSTVQSNATGDGVVPFAIGQGATGSPFNVVVGGDGRSIYEETNLRAPVKRNVATGVFTLDVSDTVSMNVDVSYGKVETTNITEALDANFMQINPDNAYILNVPDFVAAQAAGQISSGGPAFFNKDWTSQADSRTTFTTEVKRGALGFDGQFGDSSWTWDAYYQYGKTDRTQFVNDNRHLIAYNLAIDAVIGPGGEIMCRVTRDGVPVDATYDPRIAQGCVPLNPFGAGPISQAAHDYAFGFLRETLDYEQQVAAFNVSGDLFAGFGAGAVQAASGVEYRVEKGVNLAAQGIPDYTRTDYLIQYGESFAGDVDVIEGFIEVNLPLLRDAPAAKVLEWNAAVRQSQYKNQGKLGTTREKRTHDITTWKLSTFWDPIEVLRLRGSLSRDSRAANFRELYYGQKISAGGNFGFCGPAGSMTDPCNYSLEGNVNLDPEKADTVTAGLVIKPQGLLAGLQLAADYFRIKISGAISQANTRRVLDGCQISGLPEFCALLTPDVAGDFSSIRDLRAVAFNGSSYKYEGVDFSASYQISLGAQDLNLRLLATKMLEQSFQPTPGGSFVDISGQTGTSNSFLADNQPAADLIANLSATYTRGAGTLTGQVRFISDGKMNWRGVTPSDPGYPSTPAGGATMNRNDVASYAVFSLSGAYTFENISSLSTIQLFAVVSNLFDRDPPIATGTGLGDAVNGGTNAIFFDTVGRTYRTGVRLSF